jgi:hypothetical protein
MNNSDLSPTLTQLRRHADANTGGLGRYLADQATILDRLRLRLAAPSQEADPLEELDRRIAAAELAALEAILREELARAAASATGTGARLSVTEFGAVGDGVQDDGPALRRAVEALKSAGPGASLHIPAGDFRLEGFHDARRRTALFLDGLRDVTIVGEYGTRLIGTEIGGVLTLHDCEGVQIRNLGLDLDPLPYTQGTIQSVEGTTVVWRADPGFLPLDGGAFALLRDAGRELGASVRDPRTGQPVSNHDDLNAVSVERAEGGLFRLRLRVDSKRYPNGETPGYLRPGAPLCLHTRGVRGAQCALWLDCCRFCRFDQVDVYASYFFAIAENHCTASKYTGCRIVPFPGRHAGAEADGFHCNSNRFGPYIENCTVLNTMDDTGNLYGRAASAVAAAGPDTLVLHANWGEEDRPGGWDWQAERRWYRPGDLILLIDPDTGEASSLAAVTEVSASHVERPSSGRAPTRRAFADGLKTRESLGHTKLISSSANYLTHDPALPVEHFAINLSVKCDGFVIRDCHMGRNTVTAWKIKASNGLFLNNRFEQHGWCCISLLWN